MFGWLFSDPLPVGSMAPDFTLADDSGQIVSLTSLRGKNVARVFYPGDNTPGCTKQLCQMAVNELDEAIAELDRACGEGDPKMIWLHLWPLFDPLREYEGFKALLARLRLP
jgi:hypothetical protein